MKLVEVYRAANSVEAHVISNRLVEVGIVAKVSGDQLEGVSGGVPFGDATSPTVWVRATDAERSVELIRQWDRRQQPDYRTPQVSPTQFGLKAIFVNVTLLAVIFAIQAAVVRRFEWGFLFVMTCYLGLGNLLFFAYQRRRTNLFSEDSDSDAGNRP